MKRNVAAAMASRPPKPWSGTSIDTETYQGWARLVCTPDLHLQVPRGRYNRAFRFLVDNGPTITAWNLRFDAEALLKHLPREILEHLLALERVDIDEWRVEIIPWKMLRISDGRQTVEMYDIQPFYASTLDDASRKFLGVGKDYHGVDPAALNTDPHAWDDINSVIGYCQTDALRTDGLTHYMAARYNALGASFHRPFSVAFVAADALVRDTMLPKLAPRMKKRAEEAYFGGWFDCVQRGHFKMAHLYDIKAAYPSELVRLEDAVKGRWVESRKPHKDALHAVVKCRADVDPDEYPFIAPLPYRRGPSKPVAYPTGTFETTVLKRTYERFQDLLTPIESYSYLPQSTTYRPYKRTVDRLVDFRETSDDIGISFAAKGGTNALYGKTLNTRTENRLTLADPRLDHFREATVMIAGQTYRVERVRREGMMYNPLHAAITTEGIRLRMWDAVTKDPESLIMVMTDGFLASKALFGKKKAKKMGDLGHEASGRLVSCGSGLYEMEGYGARTRGVTFGRMKPDTAGSGADSVNTPGPSKRGSWFEKLRDADTPRVRFLDVRPAHLSECLGGTTKAMIGDQVRTLGLKDVNVFVTFERMVNVTSDDKRVWPTIPNGRSLLTNRYVSRPIHIEANP